MYGLYTALLQGFLPCLNFLGDARLSFTEKTGLEI
jgi:hypothetical protein